MPDGRSGTLSGPSPEGTGWRVLTVVGPDGASMAIPAGVDATVSFADGRVTGRGGCNRLTGEYRLDGPRLSLGPLATTMMHCPDPAGAVEAAVLTALGVTTAWAIGEGDLTLLDADGRTVLELERIEDRSVVGTPWSATGVNNGRGGVASLVSGTSISVVFGADGSVTGSAGCNRFRGTYRLEGERLSIGPLTTTRRACRQPVMEQEGAFVAALGRATVARAEDDALELRDDGGALQARFRVAE